MTKTAPPAATQRSWASRVRAPAVILASAGLGGLGRRAASGGEEPRGLPLEEPDDDREDRDLGVDRARRAPDGRLEELVGEPNPERRHHGADELADPAEHDDHERVDDIGLAHFRIDGS